MNELIQKIVDGDHTIVESDFITYPELGGNIDVMEIAVDENPNFIKYATIEYEEKDKSTINIYEYALKNGYVPRGVDFENNPTLKKQNCIKQIVEKKLNDIIEKIKNKDYKISNEEVSNYLLIIKNVLPNYKELFFNIVVSSLKINLANRSRVINEEIIQILFQYGYIPSEKDFINNADLGKLYSMMFNAIEVNPIFIKYILLEENRNTEFGFVNYKKNIELFEKALNLGYIPNENNLKNSYFLASSKLIMKKAIEINASYFKHSKIFDDDLVELALKNGYILTKEDINNNPDLLSSNILMKKAIDIDYKYLLSSSEHFGIGFEHINSDTIKYAIDKGYNPSREEISNNSNWRNNNDIMMVFIKINPNFVELAYDFENLFDFAIDKGYNPIFIKIRDNENLLESSKLLNYLLKNDAMLYNNRFLNEYIKRDSIKGMTLEFINQIWDFIDNNIVYENMNYNEILTIIKYVYCRDNKNLYGEELYFEYSELKNQLNELIKNQHFKEFNDIVNILINTDNINTKYKLDLMNDIIYNFNKYYKLCSSFLSSNYSKKDVYLLQYLLLSNTKNEYNIETIEDLKEFNEVLYQNRKEEFNTPDKSEYDWALGDYSPNMYYNYIILMLFNMTYYEYLEKINNGFSSKDIDELINNIKNQAIKDDLSRYKTVIKFIESIINVKDTKKLKIFVHRLNEAIYKNSEAVINIYNILRNIENIKKYYYGIEISEKLLDISKLETTPEEILKNDDEIEKQKYIKEKKKYFCPNVDLYGKNLNNQSVDYIEFNDIEFTLFVHVLNAYGKGGTLEDFKKSRLVGKSYICVSPITDKYYFGFAANQDEEDDIFDYIENNKDNLKISLDYVNNVKLIFSNISPEQLVAMGNEDLWSEADDNSLEITTTIEEKYAPIRKNVDSLHHKNYCEYVLYREDNEGNVIYPTAILSTNYRPSQSEIIAAAYLQVPILHINEDYDYDYDNDNDNDYKDVDLIESNKNQDISNSQSIAQSKSQEQLKNQLQEMKNILLKGFKNNEASVISEGRKK